MTALTRPHPSARARLAVVCLAIVCAVAIAEWSVRLALPDYDPTSQLQFDRAPATGLALGQPNTRTRQIKNSGDYNVGIVINRYGLRDDKDITTGTADDLYVIGDSFTFGWGVEQKERFSDRLAALTGRRVFNIATTGNIDAYPKLLAYIESLGAHPKRVIVAINMIDDFVETAPPEPAGAAGAVDTGVVTGSGLFYRLKKTLLRYSALYFATTTTIKSSQALQAALKRLGIVSKLDTVIWGAPPESAVDQSIDLLTGMARTHDLALMLIPSRGLWVGNRMSELSAYHERVRKKLADRGFSVIDMRPELEASRNPMQFHFRNDGHWNPTGHALAADVLAKRLAPVLR